MNDYETDDMESLTELIEGFDSDESDDLAERRRQGRRGGFGGVSKPSGRPSYQPQPTSDLYVKKSELARAMMTVDAKFKTTAEGITKVNSRVNTVADRQERQAMAIRKEISARTKADADFKNTLLLLTVVQLILPPKSIAINAPTAGLAVGDKVLVDEGNSFKSFVPLGIALLGGQIGGLLGGLESGGSSSSSNL